MAYIIDCVACGWHHYDAEDIDDKYYRCPMTKEVVETPTHTFEDLMETFRFTLDGYGGKVMYSIEPITFPFNERKLLKPLPGPIQESIAQGFHGTLAQRIKSLIDAAEGGDNE